MKLQDTDTAQSSGPPEGGTTNSRFLILSFGFNLPLAVVLIVLWRNSSNKEPAKVPVTTISIPQNTSTVPQPEPVAAVVVTAATGTNSPFHWRTIESEDYRKYIANLRAIGCPEETIRDIIVAE